MIELEEKNWEEEISTPGIIVVDFFADWCGPCKSLARTLEELSEELDSVKFVKINVEDCDSAAEKFGIRNVPTLIIFKDGEMKKKSVGSIPKDKIKQLIEEVNEE
jgi:thioredoxin 1